MSHRYSRALSQGTTAAVADVVAAAAVVAADAEEAHYRGVGSAVAAVAAGHVLGEAHSAVAVPLVEEGSAAAVAAVAAREETREEVGMIDRLAEARNTAVDRVVGLSSISVIIRGCQRADGAPYPPFSGGAITSQHVSVQKLYIGLTRVEVSTWWWASVT